MQEIFINDDVKEFKKEFLDRIKTNNIYFGRYSLLSSLYIFKATKILKQYEKLLIKNYNKPSLDLGYNAKIDSKFCRLARLNVQYYLTDDMVGPVEILLLQNNYKKAIKVQKKLGYDKIDINKTKEIIKRNNIKKVVVKDLKIVKKPLTMKQRIASVVLTVVCLVAILIPSVFVTNYIKVESGLIYTYNESLSGYVVGCGKFYNPQTLQIPVEYKGKKVVAIAKSAFSGKKSLTEVTIYSNIEVVGDKAFYNCTNLKQIKFIENSNISKADIETDCINTAVDIKHHYYVALYDDETMIKKFMVTFGESYVCDPLVKEGYLFSGWHDESKNLYTDSEGQSLTKWNEYNSKNLYSTYLANTNQIVFNGNGSTSGNMLNQTALTASVVTLNANTYIKEGYIFVGWSTSQNGEIEFNDKSQYIMGTNNSYTLYAKWQANTNQIVFNGNGATNGEMLNQTAKTDSTIILTANSYIKEGYTFIGWATSQNGEVVYGDNSSYAMGTNNSYTLYAKWQANSNQIVFDGNGATNGEMSNQTALTDSTIILNSNAYIKEGYTFTGWSTSQNGEIEFNDESQYVMGTNNSYTLYAKWQANTNQIEFNGNGATSGNMSNQTALTASVVTLNANTYIKEGYTFVGWSTSQNGEVVYNDNVQYSMGVNSIYTLYAQWTPNLNAIIFNGNGATGGEMLNQQAYSDTTIALNKNEYQKDGYTFIGWSLTENGTVDYVDEEVIMVGLKNVYILYAVWINGDIYFIHNEREFEALTSMDYNKFDEIRLMNNLDFKNAEISSFAQTFTTIFNGNGYIISNIKLTNKYGLFKSISSANIKNLGLINVILTSNNDGNYGALVGLSDNSVIEQCYTTGTISIDCCTYDNQDLRVSAGGLVGKLDSYTNNTIKNCYSTCDINAKANFYTFAGGLIGEFTAGSSVVVTIENCYATGNVTTYSNPNKDGSRAYAGGFIGDVNTYSSGHGAILNIKNCFAMGNLDSHAKLYAHVYSFGGISNVIYNSNNIFTYKEQKLYRNGEIISSSNSEGKELLELIEFAYNNWDNTIWILTQDQLPILK